jgi:hypothetical protein
VDIAAHTADSLGTARLDDVVAALRALTGHRDDLVRTRTQTINRLHALLTQLIPAGAAQAQRGPGRAGPAPPSPAP